MRYILEGMRMTEDFDDTVYKQRCPKCGDSVVYDPLEQRIICHSCGTEFQPNEIERFGLIFNGRKWRDDEAFLYHCPSCGGNLIYSKNDITVKCPYCSSYLVLSNRLLKSYRPNKIIPFKFDSDTAVSVTKQYLKNSGMDEYEIEKCRVTGIKGIYLPFWTYSTRMFGYARMRCGDGVISKDRYRDRYIVGSAVYQSVSVDGLKKMPNEVSESIEPFDFTETEDFESVYLTDFATEDYDVDMNDCFQCAKERMTSYLTHLFIDEIEGYRDVFCEKITVRAPTALADLVLCPIWLIDVDYCGKTFRYTINGQNGRINGDLPKIKDPREIAIKALPWVLQIIPLAILNSTSGLLRIVSLCVSETIIIGGTIYIYKRYKRSGPKLIEINSTYYLRPKSKKILYNSDKALKVDWVYKP